MAKGGARPGAGRKKGGKNERTQQWEHLGDFLTQEAAHRAAGIMSKATDKEFMFYFERLLNYFKPKQSSQDVTADVQATIKVIDATDGDSNNTT